MDAETLTLAVLLTPGALALPVIAALWHRSNKEAATERAVFAELHTDRPTPPPTPGHPAPVPAPAQGAVPDLRPVPEPKAQPPAPVIDLTTRRRVA